MTHQCDKSVFYRVVACSWNFSPVINPQALDVSRRFGSVLNERL